MPNIFLLIATAGSLVDGIIPFVAIAHADAYGLLKQNRDVFIVPPFVSYFYILSNEC